MSNKTILAFLQNQYFKDAVRVKAIYDRRPELRNQLIKRFLFAGCLTGKRLQGALGKDLCNQIIWEETSKEIGGHSSSVFKADVNHMAEAIKKFQPEIVICFGNVASNAMLQVGWQSFANSISFRVFYAPHPTARKNPMPALRELKIDIEKYLATLEQVNAH